VSRYSSEDFDRADEQIVAVLAHQDSFAALVVLVCGMVDASSFRFVDSKLRRAFVLVPGHLRKLSPIAMERM
jgi:hypothetical protein